MKTRIVSVLQAVVILFAMSAASGCFVGHGGGWDHSHSGSGSHDR